MSPGAKLVARSVLVSRGRSLTPSWLRCYFSHTGPPSGTATHAPKLVAYKTTEMRASLVGKVLSLILFVCMLAEAASCQGKDSSGTPYGPDYPWGQNGIEGHEAGFDGKPGDEAAVSAAMG